MAKIKSSLILSLLLCAFAIGQSPNVTITGKLQGPNGLPAANNIISFTPSQTFFVAGQGGGSGCTSYTIEINGTALTCGDTINFNNSSPAAPANGLNITWNKSTTGGVDSVSAAVVGDGSATDCLLGTGSFAPCPGAGSSAINALIGVYATNQTGTFTATGFCGALPVTPLGNLSNVAPTGSLGAGITVTSSSGAASTATIIGMNFCLNGGVSLLGMEAFSHWAYRASIGNTANVRYWHGLACYNSSGAGGNTLQITNSTAYANDTPNKSTIGFRYSAGTDSHWQAVAITAGGSQTTVDTGISPDTNVHLFEMTTNTAGTAVSFLIDSALVATISTNLPPPANTANSWGSLFFTGDNKNTATQISSTFYSMQMVPKI